MKQRIAAFDIMKGIAILLVIVGHCQLIPKWIPHWIYSFHMPLFFLISGWFYKGYSNTNDFLKKNYQRLLIPFLFTTLIMVIYNLVATIRYSNWGIMKEQLVAIAFPTGIYRPWMWQFLTGPSEIGPIWFLISLFWCRIITDFLIHKRMPIWAIFLIAIAATLTDNYLINLPFGILPGISAITFYLIGYIFSSRLIPIWVIILCVICWPLAIHFSSLGMSHCIYHIYPLDVLGACGGTIVIWYISRFIEKHTKITSQCLIWIGQGSLAVLCIHTLQKNCYVLEHIPLPNTWYVQLPLEVLITVGLTWICSKILFTRKVFGL